MNRHELAGLLSTMDFLPADHHPEACLPMADQILAWFAEQGAGLESDLERLVNRYSAENASNTPDFILAQYLLRCLDAWNRSVVERERWYGRHGGSLVATGELTTEDVARGLAALRENDHSDPVTTHSEVPRSSPVSPQEPPPMYPGSMREV